MVNPLLARKRGLLPYGKQREIAKKAGVSEAYVSAVVNDRLRPVTVEGQRNLRRVRVLVARALGVRVDEAFPPHDPADSIDADRTAIPA